MDHPLVTRPAILLVDDDAPTLTAWAELLGEDYAVSVARDGASALARCAEQRFDVVVTDVYMPGMSGIELARSLQESHPETEVVVITGNPDLDTARELIRISVVDYLKKPFRLEEMEAAIDRCLVRKRMRTSLASLQTQASSRTSGRPVGLARLFGDSPAIQHLRAAIARIQHVDTTVLITGSTGVGKEVAARAIHEGSHRAAGPFVAVNCANLSRDLLESELFGHAKGAFTGADQDHPGLVEQVAGGTLLLDEVGEMPLDLQPKLLRVLQERQVRRIGEAKDRQVDVRLLAATNRDLAQEVRAGRFREDLLFRLNVYPVRVPSLARRRQDIPSLAESLAQTLAREQGLTPKVLSREVLIRLRERDWPGNVRELKNIVERVLLVTDGPTARESDLDVALDLDAVTPMPAPAPRIADLFATSPGGKAPCRAVGPEGLVAEPGLVPRLEDVATAHIERVYRECNGNKKRAAQILGIHPATLARKLGG